MSENNTKITEERTETPNRESTSTSSIGNLVLELRKRALTAYRKKLHDQELEEKAKSFHSTAAKEGVVVAAGDFVDESATNDPGMPQIITQYDESLTLPENIESNQENMQRKIFNILDIFFISKEIMICIFDNLY